MQLLGWRKLAGALITIVLLLGYGWFKMEDQAGHIEVVKFCSYVAMALMAGNGMAAIGNALGKNGKSGSQQ